MTIAITLKVNDGVVIASDSATTMTLGADRNVYNNADKIFNLHKGSPIGAVVFGMGNIGPASLSTLIKDLRKRFATGEAKWRIDPRKYTVEAVAKQVSTFLFEEHYRPHCEKHIKGFKELPPYECPYLGLLIAGYSANESQAEVVRIDIEKEAKVEVVVTRDQNVGMNWGGDATAIQRLLLGYDYRMPRLVVEEMQPEMKPKDSAPGEAPEAEASELVDARKQAIERMSKAFKAASNGVEPLILPSSMPMQDVIDLADFLVELSAKYSRYTPGHQSVGGPIDIAAITKHEGFKWVRRKHYYDPALNPGATK